MLIPKPEDNLVQFSPVFDRISSIIYHATMVGDKPVKTNVSLNVKDVTHIRAALCEFVGVEELIKQLYPKLDNSKYQIYKSLNPTLHMLKLLRNYNIHISNTEIDQKQMMVRTLIKEHKEFEINIEYISNLSVYELRKLRSSKDYKDDQLEEMINNFNVQQHSFGIATLIIKAAIDYSKKLAEVLSEHARSV